MRLAVRHAGEGGFGFGPGEAGQRRRERQHRKLQRDPERRHRKDRRAKPRSKPVRPRRGEPTKVVIVEGGNKGETIPLDGGPLLIGRGNDAAIRLDDDYVSTRHARIASSGDQWFVEDLGSTNGTYVGTSRISQATALQVGTQVRIGKTILELRK